MQTRIKLVRDKRDEKLIRVYENLRAGPLNIGVIKLQEGSWKLFDRMNTEVYTSVDLSEVVKVTKEIYQDSDETHNPDVKGRQGFKNDGRLFGNTFGCFC